MSNYSKEKKDLLQRVLQDDIEILLEEFEELTDREVRQISISRVDCDEKTYHKAFEYIVKVSG